MLSSQRLCWFQNINDNMWKFFSNKEQLCQDVTSNIICYLRTCINAIISYKPVKMTL